MSSDATSRPDVDVAIVGGGLVGTALACALAPLGWAVAVIEARPVAAGEATSTNHDPRCFALAAASCRILEGLDAWPALAASAGPIRDIVVTEKGRPGRVHLDPAELGLDAFGQVVPAPALGRVLLDRARGLDGVVMHQGAVVTALQQADDRVTLAMDRGPAADGSGPAHLSASLVVAADGADSPVREMLGIGTRRKDYGQTAVVCHVTPAQHHRGRAFERMTADGPFAMLPLPNGRCGLVWCAPPGRAAELMEAPDEDFLAEAGGRSGGVLGTFSEAGARRAWPLSLVVPERDVDDRVVLVGNAAHTIHPAGAQGFNLGLRDVAALAEALSGHTAGSSSRPIDAGDPARLAAYASARAADRKATVAFTDGLVGLFSSAMPFAASARSGALLAHALLPPLRRRLVSAAMGYRPPVSRLALGEPLAPVREGAS
ncbi:NAD(P)-binding protein [Marinihelvus fidelis]|uniref:NAD(P)-binding protein n=1 Tax=Marinihelvus fidelis TaxID=2613842 RepID=A0A5N0T745_9GAMM|nr:FAD-dependent oxidoreductase [Marinihelvus fidelis]KAA9130803.1 NAD(P)-binding protein [Marinihelvus fidelis]